MQVIQLIFPGFLVVCKLSLGKVSVFFSVKQVSIFQKVLELTLLIIPYF